MSSVCIYSVESHEDQEEPAVSRLLTASAEGKGCGKSTTQLDRVMESGRSADLQIKGAQKEQRRSTEGKREERRCRVKTEVWMLVVGGGGTCPLHNPVKQHYQPKTLWLSSGTQVVSHNLRRLGPPDAPHRGSGQERSSVMPEDLRTVVTPWIYSIAMTRRPVWWLRSCSIQTTSGIKMS